MRPLLSPGRPARRIATVRLSRGPGAERGKKLAAGTICSLAFHPSINEWNHRREVQLEVKDFQLIEGDGHAPPA